MSRFVVKDTYSRKAKQEGFRARSAYKLQEIQDRFHVIMKGDKILDLGSAPGSFLQILSRLTGEAGIVIGIDLVPVRSLPQKNVVTIEGDVTSLNIREVLNYHGLASFDVITCDVAPNLSGIGEVDEQNVLGLFQAVHEIVVQSLRPGGNFLFKSFYSEMHREINDGLKNIFRKVTVFKPAASRSASSEVYLVCNGKKSAGFRLRVQR
jgi:23S rRNA (uridine2552-2'-O)-methyltransferase